MMTVAFSMASLNRGAGHDGMTMPKQGKNHHHANISNSYDDMTKVAFSRARDIPLFFIKNLLSLTQDIVEYNHIVITLRNNSMMTVFTPKTNRHIVIN